MLTFLSKNGCVCVFGDGRLTCLNSLLDPATRDPPGTNILGGNGGGGSIFRRSSVPSISNDHLSAHYILFSADFIS